MIGCRMLEDTRNKCEPLRDQNGRGKGENFTGMDCFPRKCRKGKKDSIFLLGFFSFFFLSGPARSDSGTDIQTKWWSGGRSVGSLAVKVRDGEMAPAQGHNWLGREPVQHTHPHTGWRWWPAEGIWAYRGNQSHLREMYKSLDKDCLVLHPSFPFFFFSSFFPTPLQLPGTPAASFVALLSFSHFLSLPSSLSDLSRHFHIQISFCRFLSQQYFTVRHRNFNAIDSLLSLFSIASSVLE